MVDWPEGIPFFRLRSGYSAQPGENTLRTPMDVGPAKVRRRTTAAPSVITGSAYMTREEAQRFEQFWRDTLKDGALSFTLTDGLYGRRNMLVQSEDFSAGWGINAGLTRTNAASILPGKTASRFESDGSTSLRQVQQGVVLPSAGTYTFTAIIEQGTATHFGQYIRFPVPGEPAIAVNRVSLNWDTLAVTVSDTSAGSSFLLKSMGTGPNGGKLARLSLTSFLGSATLREFWFYPSGLGTGGALGNGTGTGIIHWAQLETGPAFTTYEPVGASYPATHVTRGGMKTYRIVGAPQFAPMGLGHRVSVSLEVLP